MPIYEEHKVNSVSKIWNSLGTFWSEFENKELIETYWQAILNASQAVQQDLFYLSLSKTISTTPEIIVSEHDYYTIYFSGVNQNVDVLSGYAYYDFPKYTYYLSGVYTVKYSGIDNSYTYTELSSGIDYIFNSGISYRFKIPFVSGVESKEYYIRYSKKLNPVIFDVYGAMIGLTKDSWIGGYYKPHALQIGTTISTLSDIPNISGIAYQDLIAKNYKFLVWALTYYQKTPYTISNVENALGIAAALPFAWYSGEVLEVSGTFITIDHGNDKIIRYYRSNLESEYLSQNFKNYEVGSGISQFEVLTSGINLYDFYNNSGVVVPLLVDNFEKFSTFVLIINSGILI